MNLQLSLRMQDKQQVQQFLGNLQDLSLGTREAFLNHFASSTEATWLYHLKTRGEHPISWWAGVVQLQMQMGIWGQDHKARADNRAHILRQLCHVLRIEKGQDPKLCSPGLLALLRYNLKHREDACQQGFIGSTLASANFEFDSVLDQNFKLTAYGAAIRTVAVGRTRLSCIVQTLLTGCTEHTPIWLPDAKTAPKDGLELAYVHVLQQSFEHIITQCEAGLAPRALHQFCSAPELLKLSIH